MVFDIDVFGDLAKSKVVFGVEKGKDDGDNVLWHIEERHDYDGAKERMGGQKSSQ